MARRRNPGAPLPRSFEAELQRALRPMIRQIQKTLPKIRTPQDAKRLGAALTREWPNKRIRELVATIGAKAEARSSRGWERVRSQNGHKRAQKRRSVDGSAQGKKHYLIDAPEYDGRKLVAEWAAAAAKLITSVRDDVVPGLSADVADALEAGTPPEELAERWRRRGVPLKFGTLEGRVKVIAQHQLATLHANVQRERARAVGITEFVWHTQGDRRVRNAHRALDGRTFSYADPPSEGLPGHPVNCRCWAESVIPDELGVSVSAAI